MMSVYAEYSSSCFSSIFYSLFLGKSSVATTLYISKWHPQFLDFVFVLLWMYTEGLINFNKWEIMLKLQLQLSLERCCLHLHHLKRYVCDGFYIAR